MAFRSFEDLDIRKPSYRLALHPYQDRQGCRDFGPKDQMTRAAVSIASSIAEGAERDSKPDFIRFLNIAKGSAVTQRLLNCSNPNTDDPQRNACTRTGARGT